MWYLRNTETVANINYEWNYWDQRIATKLEARKWNNHNSQKKIQTNVKYKSNSKQLH